MLIPHPILDPQTVAWARLDALRLISVLPSVRACRTTLLPTSDAVELRRDETGRVIATGLQTCSSPWACPVCATRIAVRRAADVHAITEAVLAAGGAAYGGVLTVSHHSGSRLDELLSVVQASWKSVFVGAARETAAGRWGLQAAVRCTEVTHGMSGWHPHIHWVIWTEHPLTDTQQAEMGAWIAGRWASAAAPLSTSWSGNAKVTEIRTPAGAASYVTKGVGEYALDTTGAPYKATHPLTLLDAARAGDCAARDLWREYEEATKGRRAIGWIWRGRVTLEDEPEDDGTDPTPDAPVIVAIPQGQWRSVLAARLGAALVRCVRDGHLDRELRLAVAHGGTQLREMLRWFVSDCVPIHLARPPDFGE